MTIDEAMEFLNANHRAVLLTHRADGGPHLTLVSAGHDEKDRVVVSSSEDRAKVRNIRRDPRASLLVMTDRFYGGGVQLDGTASIVSLPEAMEPLVDYYRRVAGEHPDWADYRRAMVDEDRCLIRLIVDRAWRS